MTFAHVPDRHPLYPEPVTFAATRGTRVRLKEAAARAGLPASELLRRAVARVLNDPAGQPRQHAEA